MSKAISESSDEGKDTGEGFPRTSELSRITALPFRIDLPIRILSQNRVQYKGWKTAYDIKKEMWKTLSWILPAPPPELQAIYIRKVTVDRRCHRKMDYGNFVGGCKYLLDWLVHTKYIVDDDPLHVMDVYSQTWIRSQQPESVVLTISELTPEDFRLCGLSPKPPHRRLESR